MSEERPRPWEDPKLTRTLSRVHWVTLVGGFVLLTRFVPPESRIHGVFALVALSLVLNFPIMLRLSKSERPAGTRAVALMLIVRLAATAWVAWKLI